MPSGSPANLDSISCSAGADQSSVQSFSLIFFITGNPGLIGYYTTYLNTLRVLLDPIARRHRSEVHIYGQSLAGFSNDFGFPNARPYSLEDQIDLLQLSLERQFVKSGDKVGQPYDNVILIGHSVGSYILLELIRRTRNISSSTQITGGILLFPTITHIAQSPSGVAISKLFKWHSSPEVLGRILQGVFSLCPEFLVVGLVKLVTQMPAEFAKVTAGFLRSKTGIWQALHMARDEMQSITEDRWDTEIWGTEKELGGGDIPPKLLFYFGRNDHWVADHTRDALMATRGRQDGDDTDSKPVMMLDGDNIPHGFCLKHGEIMAEKTKIWIEEFLWSP